MQSTCSLVEVRPNELEGVSLKGEQLDGLVEDGKTSL